MSVVTQLGNGFSLTQLANGHSLLKHSDVREVFVSASTSEMKALARAILAALGEPVDAKPEPDRSELDASKEYRWRLFSGQGNPLGAFGSARDLEYMIAEAKAYDEPSAIYELVAYVGPKPEPAERKVVRL